MRVFLAGATGVIGQALVPHLVAAGHVVAGMTRTEGKADGLRAAGAEPILCDVYDRTHLIAVVNEFRPDVVIHQLTDLPDDAAQLDARRGGNARIRTEGTRNLLDAASSSGAQKVLAQSIAWELPPGEGADAVAELERSVLAVHGVVLRYGQFYGPGTYHPTEPPGEPQVHVEAAALATVDALDAPSGVITVIDRA